MNAMDDLKDKYRDQLWLAAWTSPTHQRSSRSSSARSPDLGRIDVVTNNAGYGLFGAAEELTDEQIRHQINTDLTGSIQVVQATQHTGPQFTGGADDCWRQCLRTAYQRSSEGPHKSETERRYQKPGQGGPA
jgi:NAD(P)-dependent dehydrogenase (short-subunit alcohol dehydrogenase family)